MLTRIEKSIDKEYVDSLIRNVTPHMHSYQTYLCKLTIQCIKYVKCTQKCSVNLDVFTTLLAFSKTRFYFYGSYVVVVRNHLI